LLGFSDLNVIQPTGRFYAGLNRQPPTPLPLVSAGSSASRQDPPLKIQFAAIGLSLIFFRFRLTCTRHCGCEYVLRIVSAILWVTSWGQAQTPAPHPPRPGSAGPTPSPPPFEVNIGGQLQNDLTLTGTRRYAPGGGQCHLRCILGPWRPLFLILTSLVAGSAQFLIARASAGCHWQRILHFVRKAAAGNGRLLQL
jgi:hypothetical protein